MRTNIFSSSIRINLFLHASSMYLYLSWKSYVILADRVKKDIVDLRRQTSQSRPAYQVSISSVYQWGNGRLYPADK